MSRSVLSQARPSAHLYILVSLFVLVLASCGDTSGGTSSELDSGGVLPDAISIIDGGVDSGVDDVNGDTGPCDTLGCPCDDDIECASGYCVPTRDGGRECSELCNGDCSLEGYECLLLENSGGDLVRLCVEGDDPYCDPCEFAPDCGSLAAACVDVAEGTVCVTPCDADSPCPSGAECTTMAVDGQDGDYCVPVDGTCEPCRDEDGDGFGVGPECLGGDPDDDDPNTYPGAPELCDFIDNNGDGRIDEGFDFDSDPAHCGGCDNPCLTPSTTGFCEAGACVIESCNPGYEDCDGLDENGCEVDLNDPSRCGDCREPSAVPGTACGACGDGTWVCEEGNWDVVCAGADGLELNSCGGCVVLDGEPGDACGTCGLDSLECDGEDALVCSGNTLLNECGGCTELSVAVGASCGECGAGTWQCSDDGESLVCDDDGTATENACGGCGVLEGTPETSCGTCGTGVWTCSEDGDAVTCVGDLGDDVRNACGGCSTLDAEIGEDCGPCGGEWLCDGDDALTCVDDTTDSDGDGTCDPDDLCPGFDDRLDDDGDGVPNDCESECPPGRYGADCSGVCACLNGRCSEGLDGDGSCSCDSGFTGEFCDECDAERFGEDCDPCFPCASGVCRDGISGDGTCACDDGWEGTLCDRCEPGRYGSDCSGVCDCVRGTCDDGVDGSGVCSCPDGFDGADCSECDPGRYGPSCVACPACASNEECDDGATGSGVCECVPSSASDLICDGIDDDCDGEIDEDSLSTFYRDRDGDGYGRASSGTVEACTAPSGYVSSNTDCDDTPGTGALIYPGADEVVGDGVDQSCDGGEVCYSDGDNDGYRTNSERASADADCDDNGEALATEPSNDCNDGNPSINPGRTEVCNGVDDNCVGGIDEGVSTTYYRDSDDDGFGSSVSGTTNACSPPGGYVSNNDDCNDGDPDIYPGAEEIIGNNLDESCDGQEICYEDNDNDDYRTLLTTVSSDSDCNDSGEAGRFGLGGIDCNDFNPDINPGADDDQCDGVDDNCNRVADDEYPGVGDTEPCEAFCSIIGPGEYCNFHVFSCDSGSPRCEQIPSCPRDGGCF